MSRIAIGVAGIASGRFELLADLTVDRIHEPYRSVAYPQLPRLTGAARAAGALGAFLSGAGSTVLAFVAPGADAAPVEAALARGGRGRGAVRPDLDRRAPQRRARRWSRARASRATRRDAAPPAGDRPRAATNSSGSGSPRTVRTGTTPAHTGQVSSPSSSWLPSSRTLAEASARSTYMTPVSLRSFSVIGRSWAQRPG